MKHLLLFVTLTYTLLAINVEDASHILKAETSMKEAQNKADKEKKEIIMLVVIKDGCNWCERMVHETLPSPMIQDNLYDVVTLVTDLHSDLAKKYNATATPSVYFIGRSTGKVLFSQVGYEKPGSFLINIHFAKNKLDESQ